MPKRIFIAIIFGITFSVLASACYTRGPTEIRILSAFEQKEIETIIAEYTVQNVTPPSWILGVIFEQRWLKTYGLNNDPYNKVWLEVYLANDLIRIKPCNPQHEEWFVTDLAPGDLIAYRGPSKETIRATDQGPLHLCKEDVMMIKKGAVQYKE